jgi:hypothetical protein
MIIGMLAPLRISAAQKAAGTKAERAPAMRNPPTRSFHSIDQSMAKFCAMTMGARGYFARHRHRAAPRLPGQG